MIHRGRDQNRGTYNSGSRGGTAPRHYQEEHPGRPTGHTQGPYGDMLAGIDEEEDYGEFMHESGMIEQYRKRIKELEIEVERLNGKISELHGELNGYEIERQDMMDKYENYIDRLEDEIEKLKHIENMVEKLQADKEFHEKEIEKTRKIKEMLQNQLNNYSETGALKEMKNKMNILKEQNDRLKRLNRAAGDGTEVLKLRNELKTMSEQLKFLEKERNLLQEGNDNLEMELNKVRSRSKQAGMRGEGDLRERERVFQAEKEQLENNVEKWKRLCDELERDKEELQAKLGAGNRKDGLLNSINFESNLLDDKAGKGADGKKKQDLAVVNELEEELRRAKNDLENFTFEKKNLEKENEILKNKNQDYENDIENLREEIWKLKKDIEKGGSKKNEEMRELEYELEEKKNDLEEMESKLRGKEKEVRKLKKSLEENKRKLENIPSQPEKLLDSGIEEELNDVKKENKKLKRKISKLEDEKKNLENLQEKKNPFADSFGGAENLASSNNPEIENQLKEANEKIDLLKEQNKKFSEKCQQYKTKVKKLKNELRGGISQSNGENVFNGSFCIDPTKKKSPFANLGESEVIEDRIIEEPQIVEKKIQKPTKAKPQEIKEREKIIEDLKIKIFLLAAENDRLRGEDQLLQNIKIMKNNPLVSNLKKQLNDPVLRQRSSIRSSNNPSKRIIIHPSGFNPSSPSEKKIIKRTVIRSPSPSSHPSSRYMPPVQTQVFTRSPSKKSNHASPASNHPRPHYPSVKNSRVSNYPSFGGSPNQKVLFSNYLPVNKFSSNQPIYTKNQNNQNPQMMKTKNWQNSMMAKVIASSPNRDRTGDLVSEINEVVSRYSPNKKKSVNERSRSPSPINFQNPLKMEYNDKGFKPDRQPDFSLGNHQNPKKFLSSKNRPEMVLQNPLKKSYDKQPLNTQNQGVPFVKITHEMNQNPILSKPVNYLESNNPHFVQNSNLKSPARKMKVDYGSPKRFNKGFKDPTKSDFGRFTYNENRRPPDENSNNTGMIQGQPVFNKFPTLTKKRKPKKGISKLSSNLPPLSPKMARGDPEIMKKLGNDDDVGYVLNNVYQPENYQYRGGGIADEGDEQMIPQPKKISSLKNSNLSYGTTPISNPGGVHPYGEEGYFGDIEMGGGKIPPSFGH